MVSKVVVYSSSHKTTPMTTTATPMTTTAAAAAPKTKTCQCGSRVSETEVLFSSWTLGTGLSVILCSNCPKPK